MTPEPGHIFWLKRWDASRRIARHRKYDSILAAMNQMIYLTEVFSWLMDNWEVANAKGEYN